MAAAYVSGSSAGMAGMEAIQPSDETPGVNDHTAAGVGGERVQHIASGSLGTGAGYR